ncbi:MAG: GNAT family N-acetyltransferase [Pseudomonadota bacterium]
MKLASIDIHRADISEAPEIAEVHLASWRAAYRGIIPHKALEQMIARRGEKWWRRAISRGTHVLVVDFNGTIAGYATVGINRARTLPYEGEIYEIYLLPEFQGVGLGKQLFKKAQKALADYSLKSSVLWVLAENEQARRFYEGLGGREVAKSVETFGDKALSKVAYCWGT